MLDSVNFEWLKQNAPNTYEGLMKFMHDLWSGSSNRRERLIVNQEDAGSNPVQTANTQK